MQKFLTIVEKLPEYNVKMKNRREELKRISIGVKAPTLGVARDASQLDTKTDQIRISKEYLNSSYSSFANVHQH